MSTEKRSARETAPADVEAQVLDTIDRWVEKEVRPIARKFDQADEYPHELVEQMKELGLFGATIGQQWGGLGLSASTYAKVVTRISRVWMAPTGIFNSHLIMAACVERNGTEAQKDHFLPRFATGELRGGLVHVGALLRLLGLDAHGARIRLHHRHAAAVAAAAGEGPCTDHHHQRGTEAAGDDRQLPGIGVHARAGAGRAVGRVEIGHGTRHASTALLGRSLRDQRISSTGSTPITASPERMTVAVAATRAMRARVSAGWSACRNRSAASSRPRFHSV